jgi:transcriptional regulator with XRE-family HTH domain
MGRNIRRQRLAAGLTQERLAELANLAPRTVQKIEAGQLNLLATTIVRLRLAVRCRYDDLLP